MGKHINRGTDLDTPSERLPLSECPSAHSCFTPVSITLLLPSLSSSSVVSFLFLLQGRVDAVVPFVPLFHADSSRGEEGLGAFFVFLSVSYCHFITKTNKISGAYYKTDGVAEHCRI